MDQPPGQCGADPRITRCPNHQVPRRITRFLVEKGRRPPSVEIVGRIHVTTKEGTWDDVCPPTKRLMVQSIGRIHPLEAPAVFSR